jgi:hypothetical protein
VAQCRPSKSPRGSLSDLSPPKLVHLVELPLIPIDQVVHKFTSTLLEQSVESNLSLAFVLNPDVGIWRLVAGPRMAEVHFLTICVYRNIHSFHTTPIQATGAL